MWEQTTRNARRPGPTSRASGRSMTVRCTMRGLQIIISAGLIFLLPAYLIELSLGYRASINLPFILTLTYVVLFPGLASFIFWINGISIIGSNRSGIFLHLMPIFSTIMAILIFNEKFMVYHLVGAILIISGIILSSRGRHA